MTALALVALLAQPAPVPASRVVTLTLPHVPRVGETAWIEVELGTLARGQQIVITTVDGRLLGHVAHYGNARGKADSVYPVPLPVEVISNGKVSLRLSVQRGDSRRAPTRSELKSMRLRIMPAAPKPK